MIIIIIIIIIIMMIIFFFFFFFFFLNKKTKIFISTIKRPIFILITKIKIFPSGKI